QWFGRHLGPPRIEAMGMSRSSTSGTVPFVRFNESAKRVLALAQNEAILHNHDYVGTEHLLAGLIEDGDTLAARALQSLGIERAKVRKAIDFIIGRGEQATHATGLTVRPRTK